MTSNNLSSSASGIAGEPASMTRVVVDDAALLSPPDIAFILENQAKHFRSSMLQIALVSGTATLAIAVSVILSTGSARAALLVVPFMVTGAVVAQRRKRRQLLLELGVSEVVMSQIARATMAAWRHGRLKCGNAAHAEMARHIHAELTASATAGAGEHVDHSGSPDP